MPADHLLQSVDRFVDLVGLRRELAPYYSETGRPSVDPELMVRMLIVGYCFGIRSERRLCDEVHEKIEAEPGPGEARAVQKASAMDARARLRVQLYPIYSAQLPTFSEITF